VVLGLIITAWAFVSPATWKKLEKVSAVLLLVLSVWLVYVTFAEFSLDDLFDYAPTGDIGIMLALDLVIAMPLSWAPLIADYTRFGKRRGAAAWGTFAGYFVSSSLFYVIGSVTNAAVGEADPIGIVASYGIGIPAMMIIVFSTATTTFLDVYSAAISFKNVRPQASAKTQILVVGGAGILIALLFPLEEYENFLLLIGGAFVSLTSIMIVDYFWVKKSYDADELLREGGTYWYANGYHRAAIAIWAAGFLFYILLAFEGLFDYAVPGFSAAGTYIGSSIPTFLFVGFLYYLSQRVRGAAHA
jgi:NCS1 family nucleobase:cation symporter-1